LHYHRTIALADDEKMNQWFVISAELFTEGLSEDYSPNLKYPLHYAK
jgi:hypothetical protein